MTRTILVTPTAHGSGLTSTCLGLVGALQRQGIDVGFLKPLAQPRSPGEDDDRSTSLIRLTSPLNPPEPIPVARVEHLLSENALQSLLEQVIAAAEPVITGHDVVIVEGLAAGPGLNYAGRMNVALAKAFDADVLLVGTANGAPFERLAETMAITAQTFRASEHDRVIGAVVNRVPDGDPDPAEAVRQALAERDLALVGLIPFRTELTWLRVRDIVADLEVKVLNDGDTDRRVKEVIVGAQAVPGVLPLLREGRLVIVPGDRHDLILAACLAAMNGTRLAGLLLTVGLEPDPRVWELCRPATRTGLPIMLTPSYSYETATVVHAADSEVPIDDIDRARLVTSTVAEALDPAWLATLPTATHPTRLSPPAFRHRLTTAARLAKRRIVLPEGNEPRTLQAAILAQEQGIARCVLLAPPGDVAAQAAGLGLTWPAGIEVSDPAQVEQRYVDGLVAARRHRGMTADIAREALNDPIMLGTMMLALDEVDGLVAGAAHTTAATLRPALQVLGTAPTARLVSSIFFMCLPDEVVIYGDCAVNPDPDAGQLADIAVQSAASARAFGIEPRWR